MFNRIRDRFGTAGLVVSIMALVLALAGGAFAASGGLNAKQKKQVKAIAKTFAGKPGAPGATGPAGPTGPAGGNGTNGAAGTSVTSVAATVGECPDGGVKYTSASGNNVVCNGDPGANGKTVLSGFGAPGAVVSSDGDFYIDTDSQTIYGPKGDVTAGQWPTPGTSLQGSPWAPENQLPDGATETGVWSIYLTGSAAPAKNFLPTASSAISFPVPLAAPPTVHQPEDANFTDFDGEGPLTEGCTGSAADPTAPRGRHLCIYVSEADADAYWVSVPGFVGTAGVYLNIGALGDLTLGGSYAVTG